MTTAPSGPHSPGRMRPRSPRVLQRAVTTLLAVHPFQSRASRAIKSIAGPSGASLLRESLDSQWWSAERLQELQLTKLRRLLTYAYDHVPFYRRMLDEAGTHPGDIKTIDDFARLPLLTKDEIRNNADEMLATDPPSAAKRAQTGGSTGAPLIVWRDQPSMDRAWASYARMWTWMGYSPGDPYANLWGMRVVRRPLVARSYAGLMAWARNEHMFNAFLMDHARASAYLRQISDIRPVFLRGYVSALEALARTQAEEHHPISVGAVSTTAEMLIPQQRRMIEEAFGCRVFDQYGCGECMAIAYECEAHSGLHSCAEHCLLEIVDARGRPVEGDETGEVVITDLDNLAMPFIRYKNGDLARWASERCPCGRELPLVKEIIGRVSDMIHGANGEKVHGEFFTHLLEQLEWPAKFKVAQYQILQAADRSITCKVISGVQPGESDIAELVRYVRDQLGDLAVTVEFVDEIRVTDSGKRRFTLSEAVLKCPRES